jgi:hypothetical protein
MTENKDSRESARANFFLAAVLASSAGSAPVRVRNLSVQGALVDGASLPEEGSEVELHRGQLGARGEIVWRSGHLCGLRFHEKINVRAWIERLGHPGQQQVDRAIALLQQVGSQEPVSSVPGEAPPERPGLTEIADELEEICERLAALPQFSIELGEEVMRLDAIAHAIRRAEP